MAGNREAKHRVDALEAEIARLWAKLDLGATASLPRRANGDGSAYVEFRDGGYEIAVEERGQEYWRDCGLDLAIAARFFLFQMAVHHTGRAEVGLRREIGGYSRWNWMAPAIDLMRRIDPHHGDWAASHYARVLERAPLDEDEIRFARWPLPV